MNMRMLFFCISVNGRKNLFLSTETVEEDDVVLITALAVWIFLSGNNPDLRIGAVGIAAGKQDTRKKSYVFSLCNVFV